MLLTKSYKWFRKQGYPAHTAIAYARAEQWALDEDIEATWEYDDAVTLDDLMPEPHEEWCNRAKEELYNCEWEGHNLHWHEFRHEHEILGCIIETGSDHASLWGIIDPDDDYRRIVETELALEIMPSKTEVNADMEHLLAVYA